MLTTRIGRFRRAPRWGLHFTIFGYESYYITIDNDDDLVPPYAAAVYYAIYTLFLYAR